MKKESLEPYVRAEGRIQLSENGFLRLVVAPLNADYPFSQPLPTIFHGVTFPAGSPLTVEYQFNSYRAGYVYRFLSSEALSLHGGILAKVRQAKITVRGGGLSSTYDNVGFVPLLNLGFRWSPLALWDFRFELEGAAASQGRAFDGALEVFRHISDEGTGLSAGVRVLEGGADNEKVNTFALIQYAFLAFTYGF